MHTPQLSEMNPFDSFLAAWKQHRRCQMETLGKNSCRCEDPTSNGPAVGICIPFCEPEVIGADGFSKEDHSVQKLQDVLTATAAPII